MKNTTVGTNNASNAKKWLKETLSGMVPGASILDVGAGELANREFCHHLDYISQDFCQYDGQGDQKGLQTGRWDTSKIDIVSDITEIPRPDGSFDVVLCTEVLEHVPNPVAAMQELCRLVKPGGYLVITAPFCSMTHFAPYHFSSGFNRYFYQHHLQNLGFDVEEITPNGNYFEYLAQEVRRVGATAFEYSGVRSSYIYRWIIRLMLVFLEQASKNDKGSHEMLCFGYQVKARKQRDHLRQA